MTAGYVRLSRDDDKRNYVSIENQKLIISQYAAEQGEAIDRWYEDDGVSGYLFDRPGFSQLMAGLDQDIDTVYVKDFSRLGRHNAKVLLLLDEFQERQKRLIVIDDHYDSRDSSDDTIGIKTWFNERYVKDTSKKIKHAIHARQKEGTLVTQPPFGYRRNPKDQGLLEIFPEEAQHVRLIYELYLSGSGCRRIANTLTDRGIPTPSMARRRRQLEKGRITKRPAAPDWSDSMVRDMLGNDFYIGTLRLRKRARNTIHGADKRVPKEEQYVFENHHPAIIDQDTFLLVQEKRAQRSRSHFRDNQGQGPKAAPHNLFGGLLFCRDCNSRLTTIRRKAAGTERRYYICSTYNTKGRRFCQSAHLVEESDLKEDVFHYLRLCRKTLGDAIAAYNMGDFDTRKKAWEEKRQKLQAAIEGQKSQLRTLLEQKVKDLSLSGGNEDLIAEAYASMQNSLLARTHHLERQLAELSDAEPLRPDARKMQKNALDVLDRIIAEKALNQADLGLLFDRIVIDEKGFPEIILHHKLSLPADCSPAAEMNLPEHSVIVLVMKLIAEDSRGYTSARYLSRQLTALGIPKTTRGILPYLGLMKQLGILTDTGDPLKPYAIARTAEEITALTARFLPRLSAEATASELSERFLHHSVSGRRHAPDGI